MNTKSLISVLVISIIFWGCSSIVTKTEIYKPIINDLKNGDYSAAVSKLNSVEFEGQYSNKDRLLYYLDKGIIHHYAGKYESSNSAFERAEYLIDSLYTQSISKGAASLILNDNVLAYSGEVYENLYINIFKALNYLHLNKFDESYVEVHRISDKLKSLNAIYRDEISQMNKSDNTKIEVRSKDIDFYDDVFAEFISHIIYRASGETDDSRISLENAKKAWRMYPDVYNYQQPAALENASSKNTTLLNIIAFAGNSPKKIPVGARITTFNNFITISDPSLYSVQPIPLPGIKSGWNFKFEFPAMEEGGTFVNNIEVYIDSNYAGNLHLLENISNVAIKTFDSHKNLIFFKTALRAIAKGIGAGVLGKSIKKRTKSEGLGDLLSFVLNAAVDVTEHADLRTWRTLPGYSFIGEFPIEEGTHNVEIHFLDTDGNILFVKSIENYSIEKNLNIIETFYLN